MVDSNVVNEIACFEQEAYRKISEALSLEESKEQSNLMLDKSLLNGAKNDVIVLDIFGLNLLDASCLLDVVDELIDEIMNIEDADDDEILMWFALATTGSCELGTRPVRMHFK